MALHTMNVQDGNMLLQLIDDEGTTKEIQNMYPLGRGTDVMAYILHRYAAFSQFESGHTLKLKMDLDAQMRGTLESPTTASFQSLHARIMNAYYNLSVDDRRSLREMAECFRNMIFFQCPETIIQSFNEKMRERDVQLDDLTGTVDVIRYVFAASDLRANIKAMQLQRTGRGLVSAPRSDPNKDRKQPAARDESGPPPSPCRICLKAGLGEHLHWHSQCPNRTGATPAKPAGRAQVAVDRTEQRRQDTPDYDEPVESYNNFFDLPREASYDPARRHWSRFQRARRGSGSRGLRPGEAQKRQLHETAAELPAEAPAAPRARDQVHRDHRPHPRGRLPHGQGGPILHPRGSAARRAAGCTRGRLP